MAAILSPKEEEKVPGVEILIPVPHSGKIPKQVNDALDKISVNNTSNGKQDSLTKIINAYKMQITIYTVNINGALGYLIFIQSHNDRVLIKLAELYSFPRGFPLLIFPDGRARLFGFYPKFNNDDRANSTSDSVFAEAVGMRGSLKYSGFLAGVLPFNYEGRYYAIAVSKNSADDGATRKDAQDHGKYVRSIRKLIKTNPKFLLAIIALAREGKYIYGECLVKFDQVHGYPLCQDGFVVTCIGRSTFWSIQDGADNVSGQSLVNFESQEAIHAFCMEYGLHRDGFFHVEGKDQVITLMKALEAGRDSMSIDSLLAIICKFSDWTPGNITHKEMIASLVVEGLVISLRQADGTLATVKYKFPAYTIRTMLFRSALADCVVSTERIDRFLETWVLFPEGRDYWRNFAKAFFVAWKQNICSIPDDNIIAPHILISEQMTLELIAELAPQFEIVFAPKFVDVILVIGPIGGGKTTTAAVLISQLESMGVRVAHLDTDVFGGMTMEQVMELKGERNSATVSAILQLIIQGFIPVISSNGGSIATLIDDAKKILGVDIRINLFIPSDISKVGFGVADLANIKENTKDLYIGRKADACVEAAVMSRLDREEWTLPKGNSLVAFIKKIQNLNRGNLRFAQKFLEQAAGRVFTFPTFNPKNHHEMISALKIAEIPEGLLTLQSPPELPDAKVSQVRCVLSVEGTMCAGHMTVCYSQSTCLIPTKEIQLFTDKMPRTPITGMLVTATAIDDPSSKIVIAVPDDPNAIPSTEHLAQHADGSAHITVDPGNHAPAMMRTVASALRADLSTVIIPNRGNGETTYNLVDATRVRTTLTFLCVSFK